MHQVGQNASSETQLNQAFIITSMGNMDKSHKSFTSEVKEKEKYDTVQIDRQVLSRQKYGQEALDPR